jgi:hypothetical protein
MPIGWATIGGSVDDRQACEFYGSPGRGVELEAN